MPRLAIPVFKSRVSPVFDTCTRVLLVDIETDCSIDKIDKHEIYLDGFSLSERLTILKKSDVTIVICGGISGTLQQMLRRAGIELITGIAGAVDQVLSGYMVRALGEPRFHMPGLNEDE
jgi:predicted Fe-Mo cluster-binding NifX family protein